MVQSTGFRMQDSLRLLYGPATMCIRVLLIEDENEIADFIVRGLREESFDVHRSADGIDGWQQTA